MIRGERGEKIEIQGGGAKIPRGLGFGPMWGSVFAHIQRSQTSPMRHSRGKASWGPEDGLMEGKPPAIGLELPKTWMRRNLKKKLWELSRRFVVVDNMPQMSHKMKKGLGSERTC